MIRLTALDALDPLAFLASLGCLAAISERLRGTGRTAPRLGFELDSAAFVARLEGIDDEDELLDLLIADLDGLAGREAEPRDPFLDFSYPGKKDKEGEEVQDLKPPPDHFRALAQGWLDEARPDSRRTVDWASAVLTDVAVDNNEASKPFALHFTAGNQRFLTIAAELLDGKGKTPGVGREDLRAAVFGPWPNDRPLKVFSWSPTQDRPYALRGLDPASDKKLGTPGADWLALRGLVLLSSAPVGQRIMTGGVHGNWKTASFSYPVWERGLEVDAVRSLLRHPAVQAEPTANEGTLPRGVEILTCRISRSDQGGYGAFSRPTRRQLKP